MNRIEWSPSANKAKLAIILRLMNLNLPAALKLASAIESEINRLLIYPELGRQGRVPGTRELIISGTRYLAIYKIKGASRSTILRLIHSAQRWPKKSLKG